MSTAGHIVFGVEHIIVMTLWAFLTWLVVSNIWLIMIKQKRWKTPPLLLFYVLTFIAIVLRDFELITFLAKGLD